MSGYTDDIISNHGVLESNVQFLGKPFTPLMLANKIREVLEHSTGSQLT
jgi:two-component system, cell cycle sensor histidine kinase and response regulator CckA